MSDTSSLVMPDAVLITGTSGSFYTARFVTGSGSPSGSSIIVANDWFIQGNLYQIYPDGSAAVVSSQIWHVDTPDTRVIRYSSGSYYLTAYTSPPKYSGYTASLALFYL